MFAAFAALTILEIGMWFIFFVFLSVGTYYDRKGEGAMKWWVVLVGLIALAVTNTPPGWTFLGIWQSLTTMSFVPVLWYAALGLGYSIIEFVIGVRDAAKKYKSDWEKHLEQTNDQYMSVEDEQQRKRSEVRNSQIYELVRNDAALNWRMVDVAKRLSRSFVSHYSNDRSVVNLCVNNNGIDIDPKINRNELTVLVGAWVTFWPAYALSLIFGDLWSKVADVIVSLSGRFIRISFSGVFKV